MKGQQTSFRTSSRALGHSSCLERYSAHLNSRCSIVASGVQWLYFIFAPVRPGVLLPYHCEVLGGKKFGEFLDA